MNNQSFNCKILEKEEETKLRASRRNKRHRTEINEVGACMIPFIKHAQKMNHNDGE